MLKIYIFLIVIAIIYILKKYTYNIKHIQLNDRQYSFRICKKNIMREIKYLEFSIIGKNSPFNNYRTSSEFTLLSYSRFKNVRYIIEQIIKNNVEGDILEAGNWRGGSMLYAKGILNAYGIENKEIWMFDTFSGFPKNYTISDEKEKKELITGLSADRLRSNSARNVQILFEIYNLSKGINIIQGLFQETIPKTAIPKLSYLRLDADSYINTKFLLNHLYNILNVKGIIELDDYGSFPGCKKAVNEFRLNNNIKDEMRFVDDVVFWTKIKQ